MISSTRINTELARCLNIRYSLIEMFLDSCHVGSAKRIYRSAKDVLTLYALEKTLYNYLLYSFTETEIEDIIFKIREYLGILTYTSRVDYFAVRYPEIECPSDITSPFVKSDNVPSGGTGGNIINEYDDWYTQDLTAKITVDGQTQIAGINFDIDDVTIDKDTLFLEVQGDNPPYKTTGEGWHMVDTTIYWHHFYDLKVGMQVLIRWRKNN